MSYPTWDATTSRAAGAQEEEAGDDEQRKGHVTQNAQQWVGLLGLVHLKCPEIP